MSLNVFTLSDRRRLQYYLKLPVWEVREGSELWTALHCVEELDSQEGTNIATDIQARLTVLDTLDSVNGQQTALGDALKSVQSQMKRIDIPFAHDLEFFEPGGEAAAIQSFMTKLCADIRRDIGLTRGPGENRLNAVYPSGTSEQRGIFPEQRTRYYGIFR
ncbi:MAG: hypothetical protein AAF773_00865 [Cyanobacteria bacterium P01_D01_bin.115]